MMELLEFIFGSFWTFAGFLILLVYMLDFTYKCWQVLLKIIYNAKKKKL